MLSLLIPTTPSSLVLKPSVPLPLVAAAVAKGVHGLSVLALGGDSHIVRALTENSMEILARPDDAARRYAVAMDAMSLVADAPNSEAARRGFTFDAGHLIVRRCS